MISNALRYKTTCSGHEVVYNIASWFIRETEDSLCTFYAGQYRLRNHPLPTIFYFGRVDYEVDDIIDKPLIHCKTGRKLRKDLKKVAPIWRTEEGPEAIILVQCRLDLLWRAATVVELADTMEEWWHIQDIWTDIWPVRAENKALIKWGVEDPLAAGQEPGHVLASDGSICIVKGSPWYELKVFYPYSTTSNVLTTDQTNKIFTIVSCLKRDAWKASRRGDPRCQVNRLDIPDPRRVGDHQMKVGMAKAYRVAPSALECLKVETNILNAKEAAPESEAGRRQKGWALSQEFEEHLCVGLITNPL